MKEWKSVSVRPWALAETLNRLESEGWTIHEVLEFSNAWNGDSVTVVGCKEPATYMIPTGADVEISLETPESVRLILGIIAGIFIMAAILSGLIIYL